MKYFNDKIKNRKNDSGTLFNKNLIINNQMVKYKKWRGKMVIAEN